MVEILATRVVFEGWSRLSVATVRENGRTFERLIEHHGSSVCVLPYDPQRKTAILVRQFRAPVFAMSGRPDLLEAIAGMRDDEEADIAAAREAFEEAGLVLKTLDLVGATWVMPGLSTERMSLYLAPYARADRAGTGGGLPQENESIAIVELPLADLAAMVDAGTLDDLKTLALVQTLRLKQPALFS